MEVQEVARFLASVGSPLSATQEAEATKKELPSSAVLQLLDARIEALATPAHGQSSVRPAAEPCHETAPILQYIDAKLVNALESYAYATAHYTYTSAVATATEQLGDALHHVAQVQTALDANDLDGLTASLAPAQESLLYVGLSVDFFHGTVEETVAYGSAGPLTRAATYERIRELCRTLAFDLHERADTAGKTMLDVQTERGRCVVAVQGSTNAHSPNLHTLWNFALAMGSGAIVAESISGLLVDRIVEPMLDAQACWEASADARQSQLLLTEKKGVYGAAVHGLVALLVFLRKTLFLPTVSDAPALPETSLAPTLQVLVSERLVPRMVAAAKQYLLRSLDAGDSTVPMTYTACINAIRTLAMQLDDALVTNGYSRKADVPGSMVRRPGWSQLVPLSDLRKWTAELGYPVSQHMLGQVLQRVRAIILQQGDAAWESVTVERLGTMETVPEAVPEGKCVAPRPDPAPTAPPPTKPKKPSLGIKRLGAKPLAQPLKRPASSPPAQDSWAWGEAEDAASDWGWGSDQEIESMTQAAAPHDSPPAPDSGASMDAWDWTDDQESQLSSAGPSPSLSGALTPSVEKEAVPWIVSQRTTQLLQVLEQQWQLLSDPTAVQTKHAHHAMVQALYESACLYRTLMPVAHVQFLESVPLLSMLFANDCAYIADKLRGYADRTPQLPGAPIHVAGANTTLETVLATEASQVEQVGEQWRAAQLAMQTRVLDESLNEADGFLRTEDPQRFAACERAVGQVNHILQHLANVWQRVLTHQVLVRILGDLVQHVFVHVLQCMEALDDISEPESMRLAQLCRTLADAQQHMFASVAHVDMDSAGALAATVVPSWFKFSYLPEILTGSLADIDFLLFDSGGALLDYTRSEIVALVRALFAETPHRRKLLERVHKAPW
ncbi:ribosome biogenesis protein ytm1 [Malassezia vespertilionis]|uniref:Retrograde transport protein Dsl1 C-terminal domain-containing protein n=1 Tax=Malassezia vespertilionis TaxID=2020962 RepID=A0A2N1J917_9BASI|nr:ribosome biogenesis protein ytm1 [Malassezia vespertilionis]PKI83024.1 hypothetical protein MVES_002998 [Malassezia vespertilionis]WFD07788.1 ribosome biogenesis protein ytm1 [Malassezia vespertilionis]